MNDAVRRHAGPPRATKLDEVFGTIAEGAAERDLERSHPYEAVALLKNAGFGSLRLAVDQGGAGYSMREALTAVIALGAADANVAHIFRNHFVFVDTYVRRPQGPVEAGLQPKIASGALIGFASGELGMSPGTRDYSTKLTEDGNGFRLNGTKYYSTGSLYADLIMVRATNADGIDGVAVVPAERDGVERIDDWDGMGQRLTGTGTTNFQNVRVERGEVILHGPGTSYAQPYGTALAQLYLTSILAGILRNIVADSAALVKRRGRNFAHAAVQQPAEDPLLQHVVGQISSLAFAGEATVLAAADALDRAIESANAFGLRDRELAHAASLAAAKAKIVLDDITARAATLLFDVGGASATKKSFNLDRHWRNARTLASHNPALYKTQAIGDLEINGAPLPQTGFF
ncbi:hypothetical protein ASE63_23330 [Bosea sp. Root381]|uniref:acyl-CoA dehydrogenase family protein n=1 Tax=Bosea sp. Root381 TaxID=1736524 RepID=UPI0006F5BA40|nr:acyl-CoA dehydrogenase family protein [Bosea sp. Root381]KRE06892.1 hypothetical protein ASE63_23330 [Bosea sp. Root381]